MKKITTYFEKFVVVTLTILMGIIVVASTIELAYVLFINFTESYENNILIDLDNLFEIFGLFFNVLIGFELYETVKLYLKENIFHAELILLVGLIAISRKVILLDYKTMEPLSIIGIAILIGTMTGGYYVIKKVQK